MPKPARWRALLAVSDRLPSVRPWNAPKKAIGVRPLGVVTGQLEGGLDRLGAGVGEEHLGVGHRGRPGDALAHVGVDREVEVRRAVVQRAIDLGVDGGVDLGVGVSGCDDGDAGVEVEEAVAVDIVDQTPLGAIDHERIVVTLPRR